MVEVKSEIDKWIKSGNHFCEYKSRGKDSGLIRHNQSIGLLIYTKVRSFVLLSL